MLKPNRAFRTVEHGGDPAETGERRDDWLDLSMCVNPVPYAPQPPGRASWARLPRKVELAALLTAAEGHYGAPGVEHVVATPGSQAAIQILPRLFERQRVRIVAPTYAEHAACWLRAGHEVELISDVEAAPPTGVLIAVNPNNPDGRILSAERIARLAQARTRSGGWLVVDEAFGDVSPTGSAAPLVGNLNVVVLKSFGKFFGLAGLRLGFAIAPAQLSETVADEFGPWAVSGPAIEIATRALGDEAWRRSARARLERDAAALDESLTGAGLEVLGGTSLFRLTGSDRARTLFAHLSSRGIHARRFADHPDWLRFGIPAPDDAERLDAALADFTAGRTP